MTKILLISEDYIKSNSNISDNLWGKFLTPAIREAEDINLQGVLGTKLYEGLLDMVADGTIKDPENKIYKTLLDEYIQPYLLYQVLTNVLPIIGTKLSNLGPMTTEDDKAYAISATERDRLESYYQFRADFYCSRLQDYLCSNKSKLPLMGSLENKGLSPNTKSAATTDIWLGGYRNK